MLSRVANRIYWIGRYVERAETTARLIDVYSELFLDLPSSVDIGWKTVLDINGTDDAFVAAGHDPSDATEVLHFLLADTNHPGSLLSSLAFARENARTCRDIIPTEAWRALNETFLQATQSLPRAVRERHRTRALAEIVRRCQLFSGLMAGTMSHGDAYQFGRLGWQLERADMTSRVIDVAAALLLGDREELEPFYNTLWMNVLRSLSAYQMYRQYVRRRVTAPDVIGFLMNDRKFPRSIACSLHQVVDALEQLPRNETPHRLCRQILEQVAADAALAEPAALHASMDRLQVSIAELDRATFSTWFAPADAA